jgi:hypothetical protein
MENTPSTNTPSNGEKPLTPDAPRADISLTRKEQRREMKRVHLHIIRAMQYTALLYTVNLNRNRDVAMYLNQLNTALAAVLELCEYIAGEIYTLSVDLLREKVE